MLHLLLLSVGLALVAAGCGAKNRKIELKIYARLAEEQERLMLVLRNGSEVPLTLCTMNFYDETACLAVRRYPDTAEIPFEKLFDGPASPYRRRGIITVSDFVKLGPGGEARLPVDLRTVKNGCSLGDTVFVSVYFKNIDPFTCSKTAVDRCDKATQDYCRMLHCVPTAGNTYWAGEVRTPWYRVDLCRYAPRKKSVRSTERVVRRSRTHPIKRRVF